MEFSDVNRRGFLRNSASAVAVGVGLSSGTLNAASLSKAEIAEWQSRVGSQFRIGAAVLKLQSVEVTDYSTDSARPKGIRTHAIAMLFLLESGRIDVRHDRLQHGHQELHLSQVIAPQEDSGEFFEVILN